MDRLRRDAIVIGLIERLRSRGSWCGETHIQKATYLLQEMAGAETDFEFILYKHGPFSFELRDELAAMRADGFVSLRVQDPAYGPSIVPEPAAEVLRKRFPRTLGAHEERMRFVAERVTNKQVVELERLATAFYVSEHVNQGPSARAAKIHEIKPHISVEQAFEAIDIIDVWKQQAATLSSK